MSLYIHLKPIPIKDTSWENWQKNRITKLSDKEVFSELQNIMAGHCYSWFSISRGLQICLNRQILYIEHFESGNIPYEWNILCDEKVCWLRHGRPSFLNFRFNRVCLFNLRVLPIQVFGTRGKTFATSNVDMSFWTFGLAVDEPIVKVEERQVGEFRGGNGYFYAEGPEYSMEYIHDRVED